MTAVVIDPPRSPRGYLYQEECCFSIIPRWQVPARSLHVATDLEAPYIPPLDSWEAFREAVECYDEVWMIYTIPLSKHLAVPEDLRSRINLVVNPRASESRMAHLGWKSLHWTDEFGLDVSEDLWFLFRDAVTTVQASSGCPYGCHYCPWSRRVFPTRRRAKPELCAELVNRSRDSYLFCPQITGNRAWLDELLSRLVGRPFSTDLNAVHVDQFADQIRALAAAGMHSAIVGTEAFTDQALARLGCSHTAAQAGRLMRLLAELRVATDWQLRYGWGETPEDVSAGISALLDLAHAAELARAPHRILCGRFYYWHRSELSESLETHWIQGQGQPVRVEITRPDVRQAWLDGYQRLRNAGLTVVGS